MSNLPVSKAEAAGINAALEVTQGVQPTAGWQTVQPNADGIGEFYPHVKTVAPAPLTKNRQLEAPQIVDLDANPKLTMDLTKDHQDRFAEGMMMAAAKHPGGTGLGYFTPTARTTTDYTVAASGALQANTLVFARGFVNSANNGLFVVGASSTGTAIKVGAGVAETVSGYVATLEVVGFRGASADITLNGSGNLTSTVADFTTMGLVPGMEIWVGGTIGSGHDFATTAYRGFAEIVTVAATLVTLKRRAWTVASADTGTGKTIDLYFGRWLRTVAFTDADYKEPSYALELQYPKLSAGTTDMFVYALGCLVDQFKVTAPAQNIVTVELSFTGNTISDPTTTRATGGSTAAAPLAIDRYQTVTKEPYLKLLLASDETVISDDVESWSLSYMNHVVPQKQQGTLGTKRDVVGKGEIELDMTVFLTQPEAMTSCSQNLTVMFGAGFRNNDGGIFFNAPSLKCTDAPPKFPANSPVTLDLKLGAFRDATLNYTLGITLFGYLPAA